MTDAQATQFGITAFVSVIAFVTVLGIVLCPSCFICKKRTWFAETHRTLTGTMDLCYECKPKYGVGDRRRDDAK